MAEINISSGGELPVVYRHGLHELVEASRRNGSDTVAVPREAIEDVLALVKSLRPGLLGEDAIDVAALNDDELSAALGAGLGDSVPAEALPPPLLLAQLSSERAENARLESLISQLVGRITTSIAAIREECDQNKAVNNLSAALRIINGEAPPRLWVSDRYDDRSSSD
jgi:hypothetical protein